MKKYASPADLNKSSSCFELWSILFSIKLQPADLFMNYFDPAATLSGPYIQLSF